jgi:hypothetical protein
MSVPPELETYRNAVEELPPSPEQLKSPTPRTMIDNTDAMDFIWGILLRISLRQNTCTSLRNCEKIAHPTDGGY